MTPARPARVIGLDFSGARAAGRHIWLATGERRQGRLRIGKLEPADQALGVAPERGATLAALAQHLARQGDCAVGCDFPFSLPDALLPPGGWQAFIAVFAAASADAEAFRAACLAQAGGREWKRAADRVTRTPFSVYNLRLYRQSFHGLRDVLAPLVMGGRAVVLPMQAPRAGVPWLLEVCPASYLKRVGLYRGLSAYKGRSGEHRDRRATILAAAAVAGRESLAPLPARLGAVAIEDPGGDALDALLAAVATAGVLADPAAILHAADGLTAREGLVYA